MPPDCTYLPSLGTRLEEQQTDSRKSIKLHTCVFQQKLGLLLSKRFFAYQDDQTYFQRVQLWHSLPPDFAHHRASLASARKYRAPLRRTPKDILQPLCNKNE